MDTGAASTAGWGGDPFFFTEAARGGPFAWHVGDPGLEGDALGPVRHAHDDAAEYYFMYSGSAQVEVGGQELILEAGQLAYIPPDAPHNFLGPAADRDACLFCLVSPNLADNKWRVRDFRPGSESLRMEVARPFDDRDLPGDDRLTARGLTLAAGDQAVSLNAAGFEVVYLVIEGVAQVQLANGLGGGISAGTSTFPRDWPTTCTGRRMPRSCAWTAPSRPGRACRLPRMPLTRGLWISRSPSRR